MRNDSSAEMRCMKSVLSLGGITVDYNYEILLDDKWAQIAKPKGMRKMYELMMNENKARQNLWLEDKWQRESEWIANENNAKRNLQLEGKSEL